MIYLETGKFYHIYNRGNNYENLFQHQENYLQFLRFYEKYINPIADTYTWVLMKNHFHVLVRIKEDEEIGRYQPLMNPGTENFVKFQTNGNLTKSAGPTRGSQEKIPNPTKHFSHLFNAYAKYFNNQVGRVGSLFQRPFKRIHINSEVYLRRLVVYIHNNPVHHGFTENCFDYEWSSYQMILSTKPTLLKRNEVLEWFDDRENFRIVHAMKCETDDIKDLLLE